MTVLFHRDSLVQLISDTSAELLSLKDKLDNAQLNISIINNSILLSKDEHEIAVKNRIIKNTAPSKSAKVFIQS